MAEEVKEAPGDYKIWKNPSGRGESVTYLGQYRPPRGQFVFTPKDLQELGFGPGEYTVLAPRESYRPKFFSKWQKVSVTE
jgi:hypothetical protein